MGFSVAGCQPPALLQRFLASDLPVSKGKPTSGPNTRLRLKPSRSGKSQWLLGSARVGRKGKGPQSRNTKLVFLRLALHSQVSRPKKRDLKQVHPQTERQAIWSSTCLRGGGRGGEAIGAGGAACEFKGIQGEQTLCVSLL